VRRVLERRPDALGIELAEKQQRFRRDAELRVEPLTRAPAARAAARSQ